MIITTLFTTAPLLGLQALGLEEADSMLQRWDGRTRLARPC